MAIRTESEIRADRIKSMQAHIPGLSETDALILSQARFFLPADDKRQPERAAEIAERALHDLYHTGVEFFHTMLFRWLINTTTGAAQARLDRLAISR
ncbi:hypothetical protein [Bacterioplanoides sp.]|uniref:hypothetical protein n=1 Tax=Bacterioplanoides sp. TaxID=2066072 RepID=UPI003B5A64A4